MGTAQPGLPRNAAAGWAEYAFQSAPLNGQSVGAGFRYACNASADDINSFKVPAYGVFDAMVRYDLGARVPRLSGVQLQLNATNLLDTRYISFSNNLGAYYGLRRAVLANVALRW